MTNHIACHREITQLRAELEDANYKVKSLTELLMPTTVVFPPSFKLTYCESLILSALFMTNGAVKKERLAFIISHRNHGFKGNHEDCIKTVKVHISYLRRKLSVLGVQVDAVWGDGYYLTEDNKTKIKEAIANKLVVPSRKNLPPREIKGDTSYVA